MLSVIIPALNSAGTISSTLDSIFSNRISQDSFEVLVIDNGSTDDTLQIAGRYPAKILNCNTRGIGPPRNLGIRSAKGDIVCFTDSDCLVEKDWLCKISRFFDANPKADGAGGPVYPHLRPQSKIQRLSGQIFVEDQDYPMKMKKVQFGSLQGSIFGSNSAYRKDALISVRGFAEPGGSNLELSWRMISMGYDLYYLPNIRVYHVFPYSLAGVARQQFRWGRQLTSMKRKFFADEGLKEIVHIFHSLSKNAMLQLSPTDFSKKILRLVQSTSFYAGRIYGYGSTDIGQTT